MPEIDSFHYNKKPENGLCKFWIQMPSNFEKANQLVVLKISYTFYYPGFDDVAKKYYLALPINKLTMNAGSAYTNMHFRIFFYDYLKDQNTGVFVGDMDIYPQNATGSQQPAKAKLQRVADLTQPWIKDLRVTDLKGPYQDGVIVKDIDISKDVHYKAYVGGRKLERAQFLAIKWSYSINGGPKNRFLHHKEWIADEGNHLVMSRNFPDEWDGKNVAVYAFFRGESEEVKVSGFAKLTKPKKATKVDENYRPQLIWGKKVSLEFEQKVVEICEELFPDKDKIKMANGLMAAMNVETWGNFTAQHLEGETTSRNPSTMKIADFHKNGNPKSSKAVGLIQFTQPALEGMGEFAEATDATRGSLKRFNELNAVKLHYAKMGEIKQLDKVAKYLAKAKTKIETPQDIYLQIFAPKGVGQSETSVLYEKGTKDYTANKSVDKDGNNNGKIERWELLKRYWESYDAGKGERREKPNGKKDQKKEISKDGVLVLTPDENFQYFIFKDGNIKYLEGYKDVHEYFFENNSEQFIKIQSIAANEFGLVKIPNTGDGFDRYGTIDAGGSSKSEEVGKGDHYLLPSTAAALFGITSTLKIKGWKVDLGDMSSYNGSDPWQAGFDHHAGHGHLGTRSGLDIDFHYLNANGISFKGTNSSKLFDKDKNKKFFELAYLYGFRKNYCSNMLGVFGEKILGVKSISDHYDHGHIGLSNLQIQKVESIKVKLK